MSERLNVGGMRAEGGEPLWSAFGECVVGDCERWLSPGWVGAGRDNAGLAAWREGADR